MQYSCIMTASFSTDGKRSDTEYHCAVLPHAVQGSSVAVAQAVQHSGSVASVVATGGLSKSQQDMYNMDEDSNQLKIQQNLEKDDDNQNRKFIECQKTEYGVQNQEGHVQLQSDETADTVEEYKDIVIDACELEERKKVSISSFNRNCKEKVYSASLIKSKKKKDIKKDYEDFKAMAPSCLHDSREKNLILNTQESGQLLQEKADIALRTTEKQ